MTTIGSDNIYNIAINGSFDDCQNMVKSMLLMTKIQNKNNMSGVNSIKLGKNNVSNCLLFLLFL